MTKKLQVVVDDDVYRRLGYMAVDQDTSRNQLASEIISEKFSEAERDKKKTRRKKQESEEE